MFIKSSIDKPLNNKEAAKVDTKTTDTKAGKKYSLLIISRYLNDSCINKKANKAGASSHCPWYENAK